MTTYAATPFLANSDTECACESAIMQLVPMLKAFFVRRVASDDVSDAIQEVLQIVIADLAQGMIRNEACLGAYAHTIAKRRCASTYAAYARARGMQSFGDRLKDRSSDPEQIWLQAERIEQMRRVLRRLPPNEREIVERFYLREQSKEQICAELSLTQTQFRLMKSRAKAKLAAFVNRCRPSTRRVYTTAQ